jgi:phospholipase/carboxylesterase
MLSRRLFLTLAASALPLTCAQRGAISNGHLRVKPKAPTSETPPGEHPLRLGSDRDGVLIVPKGYRAGAPAPLAVMLHGAGGRAGRVASLFSVANELGVIVLAPEARAGTWDAIHDSYGPDIEFLERALEHTFDRCAIDSRRLAIGGFSDGATYGLSVGLASGDLFTHIIACSPGFIIRGGLNGKPKIYISHGTADQILPIDATSRRIAPRLKEVGYNVTYKEFEGPHSVPPAIAREAMEWLKA